MGSKSNAAAQEYLDLVYLASAAANWWDNAASSPSTQIYVALHATWPGKAGNQSTGEITNTGYTRTAVPRSGSGWSRTGQTTSNVAAVVGTTITAGTATKARFFSTGKASSGSTAYFHSGAIGGARFAFTAEITGEVFTAPGSAYANGDEVVFWASPGAVLPLGASSTVTEGTVYFVVSVSGATFQIALTSGGGAVNITTAGSGFVQKVSGIPIDANVTPRAEIGQIQCVES